MLAQGDLVYWGKKTEWAIKTEFQRYLDSVLSFIRIQAAVIMET